MWKISVYSISLLLLLNFVLIQVQAQDTIPIPLKIKAGLEVSGPAIYYSDKNILNEEAYISADLDERRSVVLAAGYLNFKYSQNNYTYLNHGNFVRIGIDYNLLKADKSQGKYWAGIGLRYGLSRFTYEVPFYQTTDYWGTTTSSIPPKTNWAHFLEACPGVRAEIFNHFSIGWSISLRMLLYSGTGKNLKPVYIPGFGNGTKTISAGLNYYIVWNIPYKKINVILKKEVKEEPEDNSDTDTNKTNNSNTSGNRQQGSGIRQ
jgi:Domain of unknown function (DUF6048)